MRVNFSSFLRKRFERTSGDMTKWNRRRFYFLLLFRTARSEFVSIQLTAVAVLILMLKIAFAFLVMDFVTITFHKQCSDEKSRVLWSINWFPIEWCELKICVQINSKLFSQMWERFSVLCDSGVFFTVSLRISDVFNGMTSAQATKWNFFYQYFSRLTHRVWIIPNLVFRINKKNLLFWQIACVSDR